MFILFCLFLLAWAVSAIVEKFKKKPANNVLSRDWILYHSSNCPACLEQITALNKSAIDCIKVDCTTTVDNCGGVFPVYPSWLNIKTNQIHTGSIKFNTFNELESELKKSPILDEQSLLKIHTAINSKIEVKTAVAEPPFLGLFG